jgi:hypothetical protein
VFNVGNRRRENVVGKSSSSKNIFEAPAAATTHDARFFDHGNSEAAQMREKLANDTLEEIITWLNTLGFLLV